MKHTRVERGPQEESRGGALDGLTCESIGRRTAAQAQHDGHASRRARPSSVSSIERGAGRYFFPFAAGTGFWPCAACLAFAAVAPCVLAALFCLSPRSLAFGDLSPMSTSPQRSQARSKSAMHGMSTRYDMDGVLQLMRRLGYIDAIPDGFLDLRFLDHAQRSAAAAADG